MLCIVKKGEDNSMYNKNISKRNKKTNIIYMYTCIKT